MRLAASGLAAVLALAGCARGRPVRQSDRMALGGGAFMMGARGACFDADGAACDGDAAPHPVVLSPFEMDVTEVTRAQFAHCVGSGVCDAAAVVGFDATRRVDEATADWPVLVSGPAAGRAYCDALGARLPTEAEFEWAARNGGTTLYPWGDEAPTCDRVGFAGCGGAPLGPVGASGDVSQAGVHDLAGSVPEWVDDDYQPSIGCAGGVAYADVCTTADCPAARCTADGPDCVSGCVPIADEQAGQSLPALPQCRQAAHALSDPVERGGGGAVVRGGGAGDRACALAGTTRRHSLGGRSAGFRCVRSAAAPVAPSRVAVRLQGCLDTTPLSAALSVLPAAGAPADPPGAAIAWDGVVFDDVPTRPARLLDGASGTASGLGCDSVTVFEPAGGAAARIGVRDAPGCVLWVGELPAGAPGGPALTLSGEAQDRCGAGCDPYAQTGCAPGYNCLSKPGETYCGRAGTVAIGSLCQTTLDDCATPGQCASEPTGGADCRLLCHTDDDCPAISPGQPDNRSRCLITAASGALACTVPCDAASASSCATGLTCRLAAAGAIGFYTDCLPRFTGAGLGEPCGPTTGCGPGLFCAFETTRVCRRVCQVSPPSDCGNDACVELAPGSRYGVCCPGGVCPG